MTLKLKKLGEANMKYYVDGKEITILNNHKIFNSGSEGKQ